MPNSTLNPITDVSPEQALRDPRVVSRAIYSDPIARNGKYFLILKEDQHFIFVVAFQHINKTINPSGESWSGGTQIELPALALPWMLSRIDEHQALIMRPRAGREPTDRAFQPAAIEGANVNLFGEQLMLSRMSNDSGYALENRSRCVHLPWANANWHQKIELTDQVLFEQGYWTILKKLGDRLPPAQVDSEKPEDLFLCADVD
jgi:hypothetical protein